MKYNYQQQEQLQNREVDELKNIYKLGDYIEKIAAIANIQLYQKEIYQYEDKQTTFNEILQYKVTKDILNEIEESWWRVKAENDKGYEKFHENINIRFTNNFRAMQRKKEFNDQDSDEELSVMEHYFYLYVNTEPLKKTNLDNFLPIDLYPYSLNQSDTPFFLIEISSIDWQKFNMLINFYDINTKVPKNTITIARNKTISQIKEYLPYSNDLLSDMINKNTQRLNIIINKFDPNNSKSMTDAYEFCETIQSNLVNLFNKLQDQEIINPLQMMRGECLKFCKGAFILEDPLTKKDIEPQSDDWVKISKLYTAHPNTPNLHKTHNDKYYNMKCTDMNEAIQKYLNISELKKMHHKNLQLMKDGTIHNARIIAGLFFYHNEINKVLKYYYEKLSLIGNSEKQHPFNKYITMIYSQLPSDLFIKQNQMDTILQTITEAITAGKEIFNKK